MNAYVHPLMKYIRKGGLPQPHCAGCGNGIIAQCTLRAIDELALDMNSMVFVSGIGCSSWIPSPLFNADTLHATHGRAITFATGVKLASPNTHVVVFTGDGDGAGIGGNHLIHAARRNIGLTVILVNNFIYGMTGGQVAPTTPYGARTSTTPFGNLEHPFDLCKLMEGAGATYVARWTTFQVKPLTASIKKALQKKGFAFIEVISQCPVQYGRRTGMEDPAKMMQWFKENSVSIQKAKEMSPEELENRIIVGEFVNIEAPELTEEYQKLFGRLRYGKN